MRDKGLDGIKIATFELSHAVVTYLSMSVTGREISTSGLGS